MAGARRPGLLVRQRRSSLDAGQVDDALLQRLWAVVGRLHTLRIALGNLSADGLVVRPDGSPALGDFGQATMAAGDAGLMADRAQLLVTTALLVGGEPAVAAAAASIGSAGLTEMLPFVQPAVLDRATRRMVRAGAWEVDDLRELAADAAGVDPPKLEQIRRVTWGSIAIAAVLGIAAYAVISAIAGVGLQNLLDELAQANAALLWGALLLSPVVQVGQAFSTMGASIRPVRLGPTLLFEYAIQFIALAVPSSAARVALEIRFFQRVGTPDPRGGPRKGRGPGSGTSGAPLAVEGGAHLPRQPRRPDPACSHPGSLPGRFGQHANLADLILVNTFVSLFAGFMPVPGGIGVAEAGYTAGLAALGIPHAAALSTTLAFRIVTFYLPPIWGGARIAVAARPLVPVIGGRSSLACPFPVRVRMLTMLDGAARASVLLGGMRRG